CSGRWRASRTTSRRRASSSPSRIVIAIPKKLPRSWETRSRTPGGAELMRPFVLELAPVVGLVAACAALAVSRATFYRHQAPPQPRLPRPTPPRALPAEERAQALSLPSSDRFADKAPAQVYADLLDEG